MTPGSHHITAGQRRATQPAVDQDWRELSLKREQFGIITGSALQLADPGVADGQLGEGIAAPPCPSIQGFSQGVQFGKTCHSLIAPSPLYQDLAKPTERPQEGARPSWPQEFDKSAELLLGLGKFSPPVAKQTAIGLKGGARLRALQTLDD